jgi:O-antigen ligase
VIIILWRHGQFGFSFVTINRAVHPIYRNHVDYACCLGILLPFAWWMRQQARGYYERLFFTATMALMLAGIFFSYTRAAWICVPLAVAVYVFVRFRLLRVLIPLALAVSIGVMGWLIHDNRYLDYSPDYEKAIAHKKFDDLVSATYRMEDISTVERFYRWVAGYYMIREHPWLGTGPSTFYSLYHNYVDRHFTTYVSDNPEQSGIHNYYLMTAVEQGIPGILIFLGLVIIFLVTGERLYHRMPKGPERTLVLAAMISFCCGLFVLTLNDTVETDKLGTFFFLSMAIVMQFHGKERGA